MAVQEPAEPDAKRQKVEVVVLEGDEEPWSLRLGHAIQGAREHNTRTEMLDMLFAAWDKNGNHVIEFEEVLPHYMKSANHTDLQEQAVREGFDGFMKVEGRKPEDGITPELFRKWLAQLSDDQVATQYVQNVQGITKDPYGMNINFAINKTFRGKTLKEMLDSPISAISGLSEHADEVFSEFGLKTVRDLGAWRFFIIARAICNLAPKEDSSALPEATTVNIREALNKEHEGKTLKNVLDLPVSAFNMCPASADGVLERLRIKTIRHLGTRKVLKWANAMVELERYECHV